MPWASRPATHAVGERPATHAVGEPAGGVAATSKEATMTLTGKAAIVTGGDSGIGHAISVALGKAGAAVTVNYHKNEAAAAATVQEIERAGGTRPVVAGRRLGRGRHAALSRRDGQGLRPPRRAGQ